MKRQKKKYQTPKHPWQAERIEEENALAKRFGLKNKREIWKAKSLLRNWRGQARVLVGLTEAERKDKQKLLFSKLKGYGLLTKDASIDDILSLNIEDVLSARLQTQLFKQGLASTVKQARQFIVHGKTQVNGNVMNSPSYNVKTNDVLCLIPGFKPVVIVKKQETVSKPSEEKTSENQNIDKPLAEVK